MRSFGSEALEYQQTLEIENTWPEKLMYSIMIPHKAWAAGERLTAVVKFQPLVKGARVLNVTTTLNETIKLWSRSGCQENTRIVATAKHDIVDGKAVVADEHHHRFRVPLLSNGSHTHVSRQSTSNTPAHTSSHTYHSNGQSYFPPVASSSGTSHSPPNPPVELAPLTTTTTRSSSSSGGGAAASVTQISPETSTQPSANASSVNLPAPQDGSELLMEPGTDVVTTLNVTVPRYATPSHSLEPIQVNHRVRWSILIANLDGHTSELRCSLPIHILDSRLAEEARVATLQTRRLLLGSSDVEGGEAVIGEEGEEADALPSYPSHVRDRVANAYLPDSATMRVANAWVVNGISPTMPQRSAQTAGPSEPSSGIHSPAPVFETWQVGPGLSRPPRSEHLPHEPQAGATTPLEWVNTELLLSLGQEAPEAPPTVLQRPTPPSRTPPEVSAHASRHGSRFPSRRGSRANSRAASPERERSASELSAMSAASSGEGASTFVHSHSTASRNIHGLFHIAMKPFTSLGSTFSLGGARAGGHANFASLASSPVGAGSGAATPAHVAEPMTSQEMLHHAFTQVPDYDMASRGFLGGGITPLSTLRDLPTYESVAAEMRAGQGLRQRAGQGEGAGPERSFSEGDLAGMFAAHVRGIPGRPSALGRMPVGTP
ncbi:hypothetical protein C8Q80DRAFT_880934 [Daedaleopsis nitida]|nr:hypothetical protein C8Q80DRAFT_880934 [Daedaleopsis nitida]